MDARMQTGMAFSFLLIVSRFSDVVITFTISPDLAGEQNVLAAYMGAGWGLLIGATAFILALSIPFYWYYLYRHRELWPAEPGMRFGSFLGYLVSGRPGPWWKAFLRRSPGWRRKAVLVGLTIPWVLVAASLMVDVLHAMAVHAPDARPFYYHIATRYYLLVIPFVAGIIALTFYGEYRLYRRAAARPHPVEAE